MFAVLYSFPWYYTTLCDDRNGGLSHKGFIEAEDAKLEDLSVACYDGEALTAAFRLDEYRLSEDSIGHHLPQFVKLMRGNLALSPKP